MCTHFGADTRLTHTHTRLYTRLILVAVLATIMEKKSCTYYSFVTMVMCTKCGAETLAYNLSQLRPLAMAAILAALLGKKTDEKLHLNARHCVPNLDTKDLTI